MAATARESFHIIDGRHGPWAGDLRKSLKSHQTTLLILNGTVSSHLLLNKLFSMKLAPESKPQDRITLFEFGRIVGKRSFDLLVQARHSNGLVIMIEELHYPVPKSHSGRTRLLCSVVRRLGVESNPATHGPLTRSTMGMPIDTSDALEAEVFFGELDDAALAEAERNEARTLPALHLPQIGRRHSPRGDRPGGASERL